jgi:5-hydroxyisourate hydrolase
MKSPITTHILDTAIGKPASGVQVVLAAGEGELWRKLAEGKTNEDGRIDNLLASDTKLVNTTYKLEFFPSEYFAKNSRKCFYPKISICFQMENPNQHYHIPLLLSGFGYSTYRGS